MNETKVRFQRFGAADARRIRTTVEYIYTGSYVDAIASGDPFDAPDTFMHRFDAYTTQATFDLVVAYVDDEPVGQTWGWPLTADNRAGWWTGLLSAPESDFTHEDGKRTFALSEIMVRREYTGRRIAHAMHDKLLSTRPERRATLLVEPDNETAYRAYRHWGWRTVTQLRPDWPDAPLFDVMTLPLPLTQ
ncbi:MAG: GNAT family N-acetyltransferase [Carbonactinosporaceae bacterium]